MKVAIAGYGVEGKASYQYWRALGHDVTIVDERDLSPYELPYGSSCILGKNAFKSLKDFELVVRTPSLPPSTIRTSGKVWSATNEFFARCPAPIIGVTGTKGKGTTSSLIAAILKAAGKTVHLVGNIGVPALEELSTISSDDVVVFELSSFQLWDLETSPQVAVVLMIEQDHLDVHKNFKDYVEAKANISKHQSAESISIYHPTNDLSRQVAERGEGRAVRYAVPDDGQVYIKSNTFFVQDTPLCETAAVQLPGAHNLENACAAISAALTVTDDISSIEKGLTSFSGLPHRLKRVRVVRDVTYYDDSIATTPGSAMAAVKAFSEPKLLILGGKDKGGDYTDLVKLCKTSDVHVLAIGSNAKSIIKLCRKQNVAVTDLAGKDMEQIVRAAADIATPGAVVILSPAAASFDMFKSYADRGEQYVAAVETL
jgi:UDP-N-acetylmuramoylalanine--D-glutamate ligase